MNPTSLRINVDPQLANPDNWWQYSRADDGLRLTDPIYGTPLHPDLPPQIFM